MANWSQSHFLQSLGWATLNSFWQMALLWCLYLAVVHFSKANTKLRYQLAVSSLFIGFGWFIGSFLLYYTNNQSDLVLFAGTISDSSPLVNIVLAAASLAYLSLLAFPSFRLYRNWRFVQRIRKEGLRKAAIGHRLFVRRVAAQLGINKPVTVYLSEIVNSPVTIGYIKPIILLPVAALNNLSTQQVEALLLHELSHIRRFDYLVNFLISIIHTTLYFNPFVKLFLSAVEAEREACCDELVLQFEYDRLSYASALLALERIASQHGVLAIAATGKYSLLNRIEKIVGMEKKKRFQFRQLAGLALALLFILACNSILIIRERASAAGVDFREIGNPFALFQDEEPRMISADHQLESSKQKSADVAVTADPSPATPFMDHLTEEVPLVVDPPMAYSPAFVQVAQDDIDASLTAEEKNQVATTIDATKKIVNNLQWKEIMETQIGEALTAQEKAMAHEEYRKEVEKINWENIAKTMKANYQQMDWARINNELNQAMTIVQIDSLQHTYTAVLSELEKAEADLVRARIQALPIPDASIRELIQAKEEMKIRLSALKAIRNNKKVVRL